MDAVRQFVKFVAVILLLLLTLIVAGGIGSFVSDSAFGPRASYVSNVTYSAPDGTPLLAYIDKSFPAGRPYPGIILVPDRWGLDEAMVKLANVLAEDSYVVIVPDVYRGTASGALARALYLASTMLEEQVMSDMQSTYDYLASLDVVIPEHIGVMGVGYGGGVALRYAAQNPQVEAVIDAYGEVLADPGALSRISGPIKGIFVKNDPFVSNADVEDFRSALEAANATYDIQIISGHNNGFFAFPEIGFPTSEVKYIWNQNVVAFFDEYLKGITPPAPAEEGDTASDES